MKVGVKSHFSLHEPCRCLWRFISWIWEHERMYIIYANKSEQLSQCKNLKNKWIFKKAVGLILFWSAVRIVRWFCHRIMLLHHPAKLRTEYRYITGFTDIDTEFRHARYIELWLPIAKCKSSHFAACISGRHFSKRSSNRKPHKTDVFPKSILAATRDQKWCAMMSYAGHHRNENA